MSNLLVALYIELNNVEALKFNIFIVISVFKCSHLKEDRFFFEKCNAFLFYDFLLRRYLMFCLSSFLTLGSHQVIFFTTSVLMCYVLVNL